MTRKSLVLFSLIIILAAACIVSSKMYYNELRHRRRVENNFAASLQQLEYYKAENGLLVARTDALQLHYSELKQLYPNIIAEIRNLKINPRHVENYSETVIHQEKEIVTALKDSILYDTVPVKTFNYRDEFYNIYGIATADTQRLHIESSDSLIQVVYRGKRHKPWLWIFSRRKLEQVVMSKNPACRVEYQKVIKVGE